MPELIAPRTRLAYARVTFPMQPTPPPSPPRRHPFALGAAWGQNFPSSAADGCSVISGHCMRFPGMASPRLRWSYFRLSFDRSRQVLLVAMSKCGEPTSGMGMIDSDSAADGIQRYELDDVQWFACGKGPDPGRARPQRRVSVGGGIRSTATTLG